MDFSEEIDGQFRVKGIWDWRYRAESISYRELKAVRLALLRLPRAVVSGISLQEVLLHVDNAAVVLITNFLVSASRPMMRELRKLKSVLDHLGVHIRSEWLPLAANRFADALSRRFTRGDLRILQQLRRSVRDGMRAPLDVFPWRPTGEHPRFLRQKIFTDLNRPWKQVDGSVCFVRQWI